MKNGDQNVGVELTNAYFGYTGIANTTVNVGKQGLTTPWTVAIDSDGNEQTGTGILALSTVGPVTLAAAYFNQTNLDKSTDASHEM
ncbi:MAG: major outer membrane protein [Aliarcobacter sp.]